MTMFSLHISRRTWLSLLLLALAWWWITIYFHFILQIAAILFVAFLLSLAIRPLADGLARWHIPRGVTVIGVYVGLIGLASILGDHLVPLITIQTEQLRTLGPALLKETLVRLTTQSWLSNWLPTLGSFSQQIAILLNALLPKIFDTAVSLGDLTIDGLIIFVLAYFFVTDGSLSERLILTVVPKVYHPHVLHYFTQIRFRLSRWILAQLAIASYLAIIWGTTLTLLGVPYAFTIALAGAVFEIIPFVGGIVALSLSLLSALTVDPWLAVWVGIIYAVITEVQAHIVAPALYGKAIRLHPALMIVALFMGAKLNGLVGVFFAVPLTVIIATLAQELQTSPSPQSLVQLGANK